MPLRILSIGDPKLRGRAARVESLGARETELFEAMISTMRQANGVGLAAPQVNVALRLVVIEVPAGHESDDHEDWDWNSTEILPSGESGHTRARRIRGAHRGLPFPARVQHVNPASPDALSPRPSGIDGKRLEIHARGLLAQALQHEIDHLDGTLVSDRAGSVRAMNQVMPDWVPSSAVKTERRSETTADSGG